MSDTPRTEWTGADGVTHTLRWCSLADVPPPRRVQLADDTLSADAAYRLVCEGTALLWQGDFHQARQMLQALGRRVDKAAERAAQRATQRAPRATDITQTFHRHRKAQAERARILGLLLVPFDADHGIPLRRAPDARLACREAHGAVDAPYAASLRELQGIIGAHEWRKKGVPVPALGASVHPHHGVFSPVRGEYLDLIRDAPLPAALTAQGPQGEAWDIGAGTGVIAALLARRGVPHVLATELAPRALACAQDNLQRLALARRVTLLQADLFPLPAADGATRRSALIVCNPPWLPGHASSAVEQAIYDADSRMLRGFLAGLAAHLLPGGEGWLILSDFAERLGLRSREQLLGWTADAGLAVAGRLDIRPRHGKAQDRDDPLHAARSGEVTSLWRLVAA
ncbi:methylase of polypeptide subunit release factors [Aquabacterium commune]|uniref:Methylase of polypeptide subunit release factors n=1 Tax=Aquabacterium commune TaxID=70586 RepID=A0A4R6R609_9BURK|nr:methyltransferase [Aquabacterium commune]TDP81391.1 methylase of polypeptide subunit release factors [Aquabacterium commune]